MSFASPLWLLGLLPWIIAAVWLFTGRRERANVPFLHLWRNPDSALPRAKSAFELPPWPILIAIIAILFAILGAAGPRLTFISRGEHPLITIIVDRGITMSALSHDQHEPQWKLLVEQLKQSLDQQIGSGPIDLILLPDGKTIHSTSDSWANLAIAQDSAPVDTRQSLPQAIASAMSKDDSPVFVITNQNLQNTDARLIQASPQDQPRNIGIVTASVATSPHPQVLVRVRNDSQPGKAILKISSAGHDVTANIDLPPRIQEQNYFVDVDSIDSNVSIDLASDVPDDLPLDNHATLILQHSPPSIEPRGDLPPEVQRIISSYSRLRPAADGAARIHVALDSVDPNQPAIIVAPTAIAHPAGSPHVIDHPINSHVDWPTVFKSDIRTAKAPGFGWQTVLSLDDQSPLIAIRESPARQVWIGFTADSWPRTTDFVIFFTNVFDWIGGSDNASHYTFQGAGAVPTTEATTSNWQQRLNSLPTSQRGGLDVTTAILLLALLMIFIASIAWATCKNCASS